MAITLQVTLTDAQESALYMMGKDEDVQAAMAQRAEANLMLENARDAKANLEKMEANLSAWEKAEAVRTTILAESSDKKIAAGTYQGADVWNYVRMAP